MSADDLAEVAERMDCPSIALVSVAWSSMRMRPDAGKALAGCSCGRVDAYL